MSVIKLSIVCGLLLAACLIETEAVSASCEAAASCIRSSVDSFANINPERTVNWEDELEKLLEARKTATPFKNINDKPICGVAKINDYLRKMKRLQVLRTDRFNRMEKCIKRQNWGQGFEPCAMPAEASMPKECSSPLAVYEMLLSPGAAPTGTSPGGRIPSSFFSLLADEKIGSRRSKRNIHPDGQDKPFARINQCLIDRCGCPEIDMCEKCYELHSSTREMVTLEQQMLYARWECGIAFKNSL